MKNDYSRRRGRADNLWLTTEIASLSGCRRPRPGSPSGAVATRMAGELLLRIQALARAGCVVVLDVRDVAVPAPPAQ